ncbi:hypothetical protein GINT2_000630 [Glugoides intestinalis]
MFFSTLESFRKTIMLSLFMMIATCENLANSMFNTINNYRSKERLQHLKSIQNLENAARDQALYMCENSILTHSNPSGNLSERVRKNGFRGTTIGENIAKSYNDNYEDVAKKWMESERHKKNILGTFNYTGIATCLDRKGSRFWVQVFGIDKSSQKETESENVISLDEKLDFDAANSFADNLDQNPQYKKGQFPGLSYQMNNGMSNFCFKVDESSPEQMGPPIDSLDDRFSGMRSHSSMFLSICSPLSVPSTPRISTMTIYKTLSRESSATSSQQTVYISVTTTPPVVSTITITKVMERSITPEITTTSQSKTTVTVTEKVEKTQTTERPVTVTRVMHEEPVTSILNVEKTITVTSTKREPTRKTVFPEMVPAFKSRFFEEEPEDLNQQMNYRFAQEPEPRIKKTSFNELFDVFLRNREKRMNPQNNENEFPNMMRQTPSRSLNSERPPRGITDTFNFMDSGLSMGRAHPNENSGFLNNPCGTPEHPCIKTIVIHE